MNYLNTLKKYHVDGDNCFVELMRFFSDNRGWYSTHNIEKLPLKYFKKGRREYAFFNGETKVRKCRDLASIPLNLLERKREGKYVYYRAVGGLEGQIQPHKPTVEVRLREDGSRYAVMV